jgi:hypothetical protein
MDGAATSGAQNLFLWFSIKPLLVVGRSALVRKVLHLQIKYSPSPAAIDILKADEMSGV